MTPLDDQLRRALTDRAAALDPSPDPLAGVEARVSRIRRRRTGLAVSSAVVAVAAVALAVPGLVPERDAAPDRVATTPTSGPSATPSTGAAVLDPAHPWAVRGDEMLLSASDRDLLQQEWAKGHPGSTLTPLLVLSYEPSGQTEVAFVSTGGELRVGWAGVEDNGVSFARDEVAKPDAAYQFALDGDEGVTRLYVVAAPDSRVEYAADGVTYRDITQISVTHKDGVGTSTTTSLGGIGVTAVESPGARVRVKAADGSVVYEAGARGSSVTSKPPNVLDWPSRGRPSVGPSVHDLEVAFSRAMGRTDGTPVGYRPLFTSDTDSGVRFTMGQAWFEGDPGAYTVSYATSERGEELFVGPITHLAPPVLAFLVGNPPGTSVDLLVLVPTPRAGQVSYDSDATGSFRPANQWLAYLHGVALVDRAKDASSDRLEVLDGNGDLDKPLYRGAVAPLLCGLKECG